MQKWERLSSEHESYLSQYSGAAKWLNELSRRVQQCADVSGERKVVEERQAQLQEVMAEKEEGALRVNNALEAGEKLYPNTASEGREIIRQELR